MIALSLAEIADIVGGRLVTAGDGEDTVVSGVVETDSRLIGAGDIFVAKPGEHSDGHLFVPAAAQAGAALAIVEHVVDADVPQIIVADVLDALADLAHAVIERVREHGDLRVVAITGSNGKTTTKNLVARILADEGETVAPRASLNNEVGAPLTMLRVTYETRYLVSELSARGQGEFTSLEGVVGGLAALIEPDVGVVLMVGKAHAGGEGGLEAIAAAKAELIEHIRPGGVAVLNADDPRVAAMAPIADDRRAAVRWFGQGPMADVRAQDVEATAAGTTLSVTADGVTRPLRLQVIGAHHVANALAAIAATTALGVTLDDAIARLETVEIAERWRMQPMGSDSVRIINDAYNASPDSVAAALRTLAQITGPDERTVAVLGAMSELGEFAGEEHDRVGELAVRLRIQRIVVVGEDARRIYLAAVAEGSWSSEAVYFDTAAEAYDYLVGELRAGDRVIVKSSNAAGLRTLGDRLGGFFS
jgi:UDP-N-acetylmuramoyl-tripeptide--D-alanyl-D-alanine ligase